jgi:hypothetical protein
LHRTTQPFARVALTALTAGGLLLSTAVAPAAAADGDPTALTATVSKLLTLPAADGFNDSAVLTVIANGPATVKPVILDDADAALTLPALPELTLTDADEDGTFKGTLALTLTGLGLTAGDYSVRVTETTLTDLTATAPLTIGSGHAVDVTLTSTDAFYPYADRYLDTVKARVTARDETGTAVPFSGYVMFNNGQVSKKAAITWAPGDDNFVYISVANLTLGSASLLAKVHGPAGPNTTATKPIALLATKLTTVALAKDVSTVYPVVDGFQDTVGIKFAAHTAGPAYVGVTGEVTISLNGTTVKSWDLVSSKTRTFTWNGLNGGKIVPGKYTVKVSAKGPQGSSRSAIMYVNVSNKKLVTKTLIKVLDAPGVFTAIDLLGTGAACPAESSPTGVVRCKGVDVDESGLSVMALAEVTVPAEVRNAHLASVRVTADTNAVSGVAFWGYSYDGVDGQSAAMPRGASTLDWLRLEKGLSSLDVEFWLGANSSVDVDWFRVEYRYKTLV